VQGKDVSRGVQFPTRKQQVEGEERLLTRTSLTKLIGHTVPSTCSISSVVIHVTRAGKTGPLHHYLHLEGKRAKVQRRDEPTNVQEDHFNVE
jgi:hypothetical protein